MVYFYGTKLQIIRGNHMHRKGIFVTLMTKKSRLPLFYYKKLMFLPLFYYKLPIFLPLFYYMNMIIRNILSDLRNWSMQ